MAVKGSFKYGARSLNMNLGYVLAAGKLDDLGFDCLGVLTTDEPLRRLLLDDKLVLKIWFYYVSEETGDDWDTALEVLDSTPGGLEDFREAFFKLVVAFSPPQARKLLPAMWDQAKQEMKSSKSISSMISSSSLLDEQESNQETTPSEKS